jgi:hypothetical protein
MPDSTPAPPWWLPANWPAPARIHAGITTRTGGVSAGPYAALNLALHVGDDAAAVAENRRIVRDGLALPTDPCWLAQMHGTRIIDAAAPGPDRHADGSHATGPGVVCAVLVADCVPVLLCDRAGTEVAAIHAGWRGIAAGVVGAGLAVMRAGPGDVLAWIGPCIDPPRYEVGAEVRDACLTRDPGAGACFVATRPGHWFADLSGLVRRQLAYGGVRHIHGGSPGAHADATRFYSHRRDGRTGRMAALVWIGVDRRDPSPRPP